MQDQVSRQYVGIDLHRRRSVIVRMDEAGKVLGVKRVLNDPVEFALAMAEAGEGPEVALEATYGYYWAADLLQESGATVHLVHPLGLHWDNRRVKNDELTPQSSPRGYGGATSRGLGGATGGEGPRELIRYRALCRYLHKARYAEDRIMPSFS